MNKFRISFGIYASTLFAFNTSAHYQADESPFIYESLGETSAENTIANVLINFSQNNPLAGLEKLDQLLIQRDRLNENWNETDFLIVFCKIIGCDKLGLQQEARSLLNFLYHNLDEKFQDKITEKFSMTEEENQETLAFMRGISTFAKSEEIQIALQSIVSELASDELPSYARNSAASFGDHDWEFFESGSQPPTAQLSSTSKFIKRWKHILKKAKEILGLLKETKELFDDAKNVLN